MTEEPQDQYDPDEQEALSYRYGDASVIVLPLSSGAFAIFGRDFKLKEILKASPGLGENLKDAILRVSSLMLEESPVRRSREKYDPSLYTTEQQTPSEKSAEDLGL